MRVIFLAAVALGGCVVHPLEPSPSEASTQASEKPLEITITKTPRKDEPPEARTAVAEPPRPEPRRDAIARVPRVRTQVPPQVPPQVPAEVPHYEPVFPLQPNATYGGTGSAAIVDCRLDPTPPCYHAHDPQSPWPLHTPGSVR